MRYCARTLLQSGDNSCGGVKESPRLDTAEIELMGDCAWSMAGRKSPTSVRRKRVRCWPIWPASQIASTRGRNRPTGSGPTVTAWRAVGICARNSARRGQFHSIGIPDGRLLIANRTGVRLNSTFVVTDVSVFQAALDLAEQSADLAERAALLTRAVELYRGKLLPGCYDDWIVTERDRLTDAYLGALRKLSRYFQEASDYERAIDCARRAVLEAPERQENHCDLMRLYEASERPSAALLQYEIWNGFLRRNGEEPGEEARELAAAIRQRAADRAGGQPANSPRRLLLYLNSFRGREAEIANLLALISPPLRR